MIRFIVGEKGVRNSNGGGGGGGATAVINCGNSATNCNNGTGTVLLVAGGGGGAGFSVGQGATTTLGNGDGGSGGPNGSGGGGGNNGDGGGPPAAAGSGASQNPPFTNKAGEGYCGGGAGSGLGANGGGGGGYTGGPAAPSNSAGGVGGSNFVHGSVLNVTNSAGSDGGATTGIDGRICILEQMINLPVSLTASSIACPGDSVTYAATSTGATVYVFFLDNDQNGEINQGDDVLQTDTVNTLISGTLTAGELLTVLVSDGQLEGRATVTIPTATDASAPTFTSCLSTYSDTLNLCGEYILNAAKLGIEATDNCGSLSFTFSPDTIFAATTTSVTAYVTDGVGLTDTCMFMLTTVNHPEAFVITAVNDTFTTNQFQAITITDSDLLSNDGTSPGGLTLEVEDVELLDPAQGTLTAIDDTTYSFTPKGSFTGMAILSYTVKVENGASFFPDNQHFYEVVNDVHQWTAARDAAANKTLAGLPGYLATITSQAENDFIQSLITKRSWIGATDESTEGDWRWVTGPEGQANGGSGTPFWLGKADGVPVDSGFNHWFNPNAKQTEPNNLVAFGNVGGEDYTYMYPSSEGISGGTWNDFPLVNNVGGYVVEYGGEDGCTPIISAKANVAIDVQADPNSGFITTWKTTAFDPSITIYTVPGLTYNFTVDWGDGTTDMNVSSTISHTYADHSKLHTVKIAGTFPHFWADNNNVDPSNGHQIQSIDQWGSIQWQSMFRAFNNALFMKYNATDAPDLSNCFTVQKMFANNFQLDENTDLSNWDVSNVVDFTHMFLNAFRFNGDVTNWTFNSNPASPIAMTGMFFQARNFNRDIGGWDVSEVGDMRAMFHTATSFDQDIGGWDVDSVTNMIDMFLGATAFSQDISGWDVGSVIEMRSMFAGATSFNIDIGMWDVSKVRGMGGMFFGATAFDQDLGGWDITGLLPGLSLLRTFTNSGMSAASYDATLIGWGSQNVTNNIKPVGVHSLAYCNGRDARQALIDDHGWTFEGDIYDKDSCGELPFITTWNTTASYPNIVIYTDPDYDYNFTIDWGDGSVDTNVTSRIFHIYTDHSTPHTVTIVGDFPHFLPYGFRCRQRGNRGNFVSIEQWGSIQWQSMDYSFCLTGQLNAIDQPDLSQVSSMGRMFFANGNIGVASLDDWDVSKIKDMSGTFAFSGSFNGDISRWDVSNVTQATSMFFRASAFNQPIDDWDVSNFLFTDMMFFISSFNQNLGSWRLNNLKSAIRMLSRSGMDVANYDNTLIGWASNPDIGSNVTIGAEGITYCAGAAARDSLINNKFWTFNDDRQCAAIVDDDANRQAAVENEVPIGLMEASTFKYYKNAETNTLHVLLDEVAEDAEFYIQDKQGRIIWSHVFQDAVDRIELQIEGNLLPEEMHRIVYDSGDEIESKQLK